MELDNLYREFEDLKNLIRNNAPHLLNRVCGVCMKSEEGSLELIQINNADVWTCEKCLNQHLHLHLGSRKEYRKWRNHKNNE